LSTAPESVRKIISEQNAEFFERRDAILGVWMCLLTGSHGYLMGPSGTAKSALLASVTKHIDGARYWHIQLDRMLDKAESFGQYDIARFEKENVWERDYSDTFGDCHIALLDELDKAGPATLVPYLEMLQGRRFKPGKAWVEAPLISAFGAANADLDSTDGSLAAFADRLLIRVSVNYLLEPANFIALVESVTQIQAESVTTISLVQLQDVRQRQVPAVRVPRSIAEALYELRTSLLAEGIVCSDRRWKGAVSVLQAHAWLNGRSVVTDDDLPVLRLVLWTSVEEIPAVTVAVGTARSKQAQIEADVEERLADLESQLSAVQTQAADQRIAWAGTAMVRLNGLTESLLGVDAELLRVRVDALRLGVYESCMAIEAAQ
jgi:MoxR-like ATPase